MPPTPPRRVFAGSQLRRLRQAENTGQAEMARRLGISVSYLSQLENDNRPLTAAVEARLRSLFPLDWRDGRAAATQRNAAVRAMFGDPFFDDLDPARLERALEQHPAFAERLVRLHSLWRTELRQRLAADEAIASGTAGDGRLPWERVRDWFHDAGNYIDTLDRAAEALAHDIGGGGEATLRRCLGERFAIEVAEAEAQEGDRDRVLRRFDKRRGVLTLDRALPAESRLFMLAHQVATGAFAPIVESEVARSGLEGDPERQLLAAGLANYAASALLMPYDAFRAAARAVRHDIDRLRQRFGTSFEQTCHRLSTLQRPTARGIPFFFCRVDMAGNITKRHSATRLQFARFGGACPLWVVHEAVAIPDRVLVQLAQTPDGVRYVSMAKGLVKASASYDQSPRRYAVALGCEVENADEFIYADGLDVAGRSALIGVSCRLCERIQCDQRAFPPTHRPIEIDPDRREVVPYRVL